MRRKRIYEAVVNRLQEASLGFVHFGLWSNFREENTPTPVFSTPAVLVEFEPVNWRMIRREIREGLLTVRVHIITDGAADDMAHFDLAETVVDTLQGLHGAEGDGFSSLIPFESVTDTLCHALRDDRESFTTRVIEMPPLPKVAPQLIPAKPAIGISHEKYEQ